jgi:hypothetical protein
MSKMTMTVFASAEPVRQLAGRPASLCTAISHVRQPEPALTYMFRAAAEQ